MNEHTKAIESSALWAAAGDAVGWISELTGPSGLKRRIGNSHVSNTVAWKRRIGGRAGPTINLPAGTYSDDTQLRLAVCRAISRASEFDVEVFAKVELPVWQSYALGAGRGTLSAAANLSKASVTWFSNFFGGVGKKGYFEAGGNGAAMRIQPHVWCSHSLDPSEFLTNVIRDAIVTHGHPQGFGGAAFHALCLAYALREGTVAGPEQWADFLVEISKLSEIVEKDNQLAMFWLGPWEDASGERLEEAMSQLLYEISNPFDSLYQDLKSRANNLNKREFYRRTLHLLGGYDDARRGAGLNTAISAAVLAWLYREEGPETAVLVAANELNSDTDTIGTMAGALLGATHTHLPKWEIQDRDYIVFEARRLAIMAQAQLTDSFPYPDLKFWKPPANQSMGAGINNNALAVSGLGRAKAISEEFPAGDYMWQWLQLEFGQTVLAKLKRETPEILERMLPSKPALYISSNSPAEGPQPSFNFANRSSKPVENVSASSATTLPTATDAFELKTDDLDQITDAIIKRDFDNSLIGRAFVEIAKGMHPIERSIAFASILAKAITARQKRQTPKN